MTRRTVLLLTYGEPASPDFGPQLRYSWRILLGLTRSVAPIPRLLLPMIALKRGRDRNRMWTAERYGSPLERITEAQARTLSRVLAENDPATEWDVRPAYEFREPLLPAAIQQMPPELPVDVVPMYAACSAFTHDLSRRLLESLRHGALKGRQVRVMPPLPEPPLAALMADHVRAELARRGVQPSREWALLMTAHGTLLEPQRPIETGRVATERLYELTARRLESSFGAVRNGWLNHVYGGQWTQPPADQALARLAEEGFRKVVYFPFGFLADNAETELEGRQVLRTQPGMEEAVHLACLNDSPGLAQLIASQLTGRLTLRAAS